MQYKSLTPSKAPWSSLNLLKFLMNPGNPLKATESLLRPLWNFPETLWKLSETSESPLETLWKYFCRSRNFMNGGPRGFCGFRCVSSGFRGNQEDFRRIREEVHTRFKQFQWVSRSVPRELWEFQGNFQGLHENIVQAPQTSKVLYWSLFKLTEIPLEPWKPLRKLLKAFWNLPENFLKPPWNLPEPSESPLKTP